MNEQAGHFADRVLRDCGADANAAKLAERAVWIALSKPAAEGRIADSATFMAKQAAVYRESGKSGSESRREALIDLCHVLFNTNEFLYVE
jgi:hypothetical protein